MSFCIRDVTCYVLTITGTQHYHQLIRLLCTYSFVKREVNIISALMYSNAIMLFHFV